MRSEQGCRSHFVRPKRAGLFTVFRLARLGISELAFVPSYPNPWPSASSELLVYIVINGEYYDGIRNILPFHRR